MLNVWCVIHNLGFAVTLKNSVALTKSKSLITLIFISLPFVSSIPEEFNGANRFYSDD